MAGREDEAVLARERDEFLGLRDGRGDRLLDQDVLARLEEMRGDVVMEGGRDGDGRGRDVRLAEEHRLDRRVGAAVEALGQELGTLDVDVDDRAEVGVRKLGERARVVRAHRARADDGDRERAALGRLRKPVLVAEPPARERHQVDAEAGRERIVDLVRGSRRSACRRRRSARTQRRPRSASHWAPDDAGPPAHEERAKEQHVGERELGRVAPREPARHVLRPRPGEVAVRVVDGEVAHGARERRADVVDDRVRHVEAPVAREAQAEGEVGVLEVAEEPLVEAADLEERVAAVQRRCGAGREGLLACEGGARGRRAVVAAPGEAVGMERVAGAVERVGRRGLEQTGGEEVEVRLVGGGAEERLQPAGLREGIGVEERDPVTVVRSPHREVVRGREADVAREPDHLDAAVPLLEPVDRAVRAGVVDDDDPRGRERLAREGVETMGQDVPAVPVHDDDANPRGGPRLHREDVGSAGLRLDRIGAASSQIRRTASRTRVSCRATVTGEGYSEGVPGVELHAWRIQGTSAGRAASLCREPAPPKRLPCRAVRPPRPWVASRPRRAPASRCAPRRP